MFFKKKTLVPQKESITAKMLNAERFTPKKLSLPAVAY